LQSPERSKGTLLGRFLAYSQDRRDLPGAQFFQVSKGKHFALGWR
jgi:hypothetical protein